MDSKIPLYISAVALFIAVVASLFFFNVIQGMKKTIKSVKVDSSKLVSLENHIDSIKSDIGKIINKVDNVCLASNKAVAPEAPKENKKKEAPETLVVEEASDDEVEVESDDEIEIEN